MLTSLSETLLVIFNIACFAMFGVALFETLRMAPASRAPLFRQTALWLVPLFILAFFIFVTAAVVAPSASMRDWLSHAIGTILDAAVIFFFAVAGLNLYRRAQEGNTYFQSPEYSRLSKQRIILEILGFIAATQFITAALFYVYPPKSTATLSELFPVNDLPALAAVAVVLLVLVKAAICEEVMFRLFLFSGLLLWAGERPGRLVVAVVFPAALWAMGHAGVIEDDWVKLLQIFLSGLLLAAAYLRLGFRACIYVHLGLNLGMILLAPLLMPPD